jgi:hypothetical protein
MALEEFLRQVKEQWSDYELDLANYQNRCRLVRGWGELFEKVDEHTLYLLYTHCTLSMKVDEHTLYTLYTLYALTIHSL